MFKKCFALGFCLVSISLMAKKLKLTSVEMGEAKEKILLLHGAHLSGSSWDLVKAELKILGVEAESMDLPGRNARSTEGTSLDENAKAVCQKLDSMGLSKVVAHSQAGAIANHAFGLCPTKFSGIIYVAAVVPMPGEKAFDQLEDRDLEWYDKAIRHDTETNIFKIVDRDFFISGFAQDLKKESLISKLKEEAVDESGAVGDSKVFFDLESWNNLKKIYIHTSDDRIVTPKTQKKFVNRSSFFRVMTIHTSHSPMLSKPLAFSKLLTRGCCSFFQ